MKTDEEIAAIDTVEQPWNALERMREEVNLWGATPSELAELADEDIDEEDGEMMEGVEHLKPEDVLAELNEYVPEPAAIDAYPPEQTKKQQSQNLEWADVGGQQAEDGVGEVLSRVRQFTEAEGRLVQRPQKGIQSRYWKKDPVILARLELVSALIVRGAKPHQIAQAIHCGLRTAKRDIARVFVLWQDLARPTIDRAKAASVAQFRAVQQAGWLAFDKSTPKNMQALRVVMEAEEQILALLGIQLRGAHVNILAQQQVNVNDPAAQYAKMSEGELDQLIGNLMVAVDPAQGVAQLMAGNNGSNQGTDLRDSDVVEGEVSAVETAEAAE